MPADLYNWWQFDPKYRLIDWRHGRVMSFLARRFGRTAERDVYEYEFDDEWS